MYNLATDTDILDKGIITLSIADILDKAEHALNWADAASTEAQRTLYIGRAEAYLLVLPIVLPDHIWEQKRVLVERVSAAYRTITF